MKVKCYDEIPNQYWLWLVSNFKNHNYYYQQVYTNVQDIYTNLIFNFKILNFVGTFDLIPKKIHLFN
jgi:hypothetical protein